MNQEQLSNKVLDIISTAWQSKESSGVCGCPECGGDMEWKRSDYNTHVSGLCRECGLEFSE